MRRNLCAFVVALSLVAAACGGGDGSGEAAGPPEEIPGVGALPAVEVLDVATGDTVDVSTFLPSDKPLLVWFWAPH
ncbi:MAG: hypothetical protein KJP12_02585 [Acidimicrobiia bacterium]|nr:hypothetical protein [Acidimicrobiia bacterium]